MDEVIADMKIEGSCADKVYEILLTCISAPTKVIDLLADVNGAEKAFRPYLVTMCIEEMRALGEEYNSEPEVIVEMPTVTYREGVSGLADHERLNIDRPISELDALFDDEMANYRLPIDWDVLTVIVDKQIKMEECMISIDLHSHPAFERREIQRSALDRHMKAMGRWKLEGRQSEHYQLTKVLKLANTRARDAAKEAGRMKKDPMISGLWDSWNGYKDECRAIVGFDTRYYGLLSSLAPFVPREQPHHIKREVRAKRIEWLKEVIKNHQEYKESFENKPITPYWVDREAAEELDDYKAHSLSLNRGEDYRDLHLMSKSRDEWMDVRNDSVQIQKTRVLHYHTSQVRDITQKYKEWNKAPSRIKI